MKYSEKLKDPRWQKKRLKVLERDNWECKQCGEKEETLHIHHLLYDKDKLEVVKIEPAATDVDPSNPFTDVPIASSGGSFDDEFDFLRVAEVAKKATSDLPTGTISLAKITFRAKEKPLVCNPADGKPIKISPALISLPSIISSYSIMPAMAQTRSTWPF